MKLMLISNHYIKPLDCSICLSWLALMGLDIRLSIPTLKHSYLKLLDAYAVNAMIEGS